MITNQRKLRVPGRNGCIQTYQPMKTASNAVTIYGHGELRKLNQFNDATFNDIALYRGTTMIP